MFSREVLNALWPEGAFWQPAQDSDYDNLLEGIAENSEKVRLDMEKLRYLRDPLRTPILPDLEKEYAVIPSTGSTEAERRSRLKPVMFRRGEIPTYDLLEDKLVEAGFDVQVHVNSPRTDPRRYFDQFFQMTAGGLLPGGNDAQAGEPGALCARGGGAELLVNGDFFTQLPNYTALCGEPGVQCGDAYAGSFDSVQLIPVEYNVPSNPGYWPMIFFVGGTALAGAGGTWYLPSKDELDLMYTNLHLSGLGNFNNSYWSSTEQDANNAWKQDFSTGTQTAIDKKSGAAIRPFRIVTEMPGSFAVGDKYTSTAYVFHVDGTDVYICTNFDLWPNPSVWSRSYGAVGTTLAGIGAGEQNTLDIIAAGFTESAAQTCQDYDTGALTIDTADVPAQRREEFRRIILRYKPMPAWAALVVSYV